MVDKSEWKTPSMESKGEGRWTPIRAKAQDTRANPNSWETHLVRKRWDIGLLRALSLWIMMMMMHVCMYVRLHAGMYVFMYVCVYCIYVCLYVRMWVCPSPGGFAQGFVRFPFCP